MSAITDAAAEYFSYGWVLCRIKGEAASTPQGRKEPAGSWAEGVRTLEELGAATGLGVVLGPSGLVCLDIDDSPTAQAWLRERGLWEAFKTGWLYQGNKKRLKALFSVDEPLPTLTNRHGLEWRSAGRYDVLPPTLHPEGYEYAKLGTWFGAKAPPLPEELRAVWLELAGEQRPMQQPKDALTAAALPVKEFREDYDFELIERECAQVRHCSENSASITYDEWFAVATITAHCKDGRRHFHRISITDEARYSEETTDAKFNDALQAHGPRTCAGWPDQRRCEGCKFRGLIKTSLHVTYGIEKAAAEALPELPKPFEWQGTQVVAKMKLPKPDEDGNTERVWTLFPVPVFVESVGYAEQALDGQIRLSVDGRVNTIPVSALSDTNFSLTMTRARAVMPTNPEAAKLAKRFIWESVRSITFERRFNKMYTHLGWQDDGSYVLGETQLRPRNAPDKVQVSATLERFHFTRRGKLQDWIQHAKVFFQEGFEAHALAMLSAFSTPLIKMLGATDSGYTLSLYSAKSGQGKSTVQRAIGTAMGDYKDFISGEADTVNARNAMMATMHSLPLMLEEFSTASPEAAQQLLYTSGSGQEKQRLTKDAHLRERSEQFYLPVIVSNNRSLLQLIGLNKMLEAAAYRCLEFNVRLPERTAFLEGDALINNLAANSGMAYPYVVQQMLDNPQWFKSRYQVRLQDISTALGTTTSAMRFRIRAAAGMMTMADFCVSDDMFSRLGVDTKALFRYVVQAIRDNESAHAEMTASSQDLLVEFATKNLPFTNIVGKFSDVRGMEFGVGVIKEPAMNQPIVGKMDVDARVVYYSARALKKFINDEGRDWKQFISELEGLGAFAPKRSGAAKLSSHLAWAKYTGVVEHTYIFNLAFIDSELGNAPPEQIAALVADKLNLAAV